MTRQFQWRIGLPSGFSVPVWATFGAASSLFIAYGANHHTKLVAGALVAALAMAVVIERIQLASALLIAASLVVAPFVGYHAWNAVVALVLGVVAVRQLLWGGRARVPWQLLAYEAGYAVVGLHAGGSHLTVSDIGAYFLMPAFAVGTAWVLDTAKLRAQIVLMLLAAAAIQIPIVLVQALPIIRSYSNVLVSQNVDLVTGGLGSSSSGTVALVTVAIALLCVALAIEKVWHPRFLYVLAAALCFPGVLSGAKAVYFFVPGGLIGLLGAYLVLSPRRVTAQQLVVISVAAVVSVPILIVASGRLYPGINDARQGLSLTNSYALNKYLTEGQGGQAPQRLAELNIASSLFSEASLPDKILGRGLAATDFTPPQDIKPISVNQPVPYLTREQQVNEVWLPRIITEGGILAVVSFIGLVAYIIALGARVQRRAPRGSVDRAVGIALPGFAALTVLSAFYAGLSIHAWATVLWLVVSVGIAAAWDHGRPSAW